MTTHPFRGIDIESCNDCGAVLLDAGELNALAGEDRSGVLASFFSMFGGASVGAEDES
jgi:Zn-finger nucleic acid-binding protein